MGLWPHDHQRIGQGVLHGLSGVVPQNRAVAAVIGQKLVEHFLGGNKRCLPERTHHGDDFRVPLIFVIGDGYPVDRVGE